MIKLVILLSLLPKDKCHRTQLPLKYKNGETSIGPSDHHCCISQISSPKGKFKSATSKVVTH